MDASTLQSKQLAQSASPLAKQFSDVRQQSLGICQPLTIEDYGLQAMAETSPPKWHLAHTTWFFETFILKSFVNNYQSFNPHYEVLFNSYYNGIGAQHPRAQRGLLSRPSVQAICEYRDAINEQILQLLDAEDHPQYPEISRRLILGLHHEQQHQELLFTDLKYSWYQNPLYPRYSEQPLSQTATPPPLEWQNFEGGLVAIGHEGDGFCLDNEFPRHNAAVNPYALASRLITNGEYLEFIEAGGYQDPRWWLSDGWAEARQQQWRAPLYWQQQSDDRWFEYTLHGLLPLDVNRPAIHVSAYEADAYARWRKARLATEQELELALIHELISEPDNAVVAGQFIDSGELHPRDSQGSSQLFGSAWEWTSSSYSPYPGFVADAGAIGEYNGKFMCNQLVLRGGSCVTSRDHIRPTYRNFFYPRDRWQFSGIRLAQSL